MAAASKDRHRGKGRYKAGRELGNHCFCHRHDFAALLSRADSSLSDRAGSRADVSSSCLALCMFWQHQGV